MGSVIRRPDQVAKRATGLALTWTFRAWPAGTRAICRREDPTRAHS